MEFLAYKNPSHQTTLVTPLAPTKSEISVLSLKQHSLEIYIPFCSLPMANNIFPSKTLHAVGLFCLMLLLQKGGATEFKIGGSKGWTVPTDPSEVHYNQWAENNRFQIGDSLVFDYPADKDSVLHVSQDDYTNCNTASPLEKFSDGHTVYQLTQSGPYYFISGNRDNCLKNEKFVLVVLADRSNSSSNTNQTSTVSPPPPPASSPAPAPTGESPPAGTVDINPTPAPVSEPPPPSEASSILITSISSLGAFTASSLFFLL